MGILLIILSLGVGGLVKLFFFVYFYDDFLRWMLVGIYILTWPILIIGVWWVGKEYYEAIRKYFSYKYYHESMKKKARMAIDRTKIIGGNVKRKLMKKEPKN